MKLLAIFQRISLITVRWVFLKITLSFIKQTERMLELAIQVIHEIIWKLGLVCHALFTYYTLIHLKRKKKIKNAWHLNHKTREFSITLPRELELDLDFFVPCGHSTAQHSTAQTRWTNHLLYNIAVDMYTVTSLSLYQDVTNDFIVHFSSGLPDG